MKPLTASIILISAQSMSGVLNLQQAVSPDRIGIFLQLSNL